MDPEGGTAFDVAAYWLTIGGLYLLQGALWYYPFKEKVFDDGLIAPKGIKEQFAGSLVDSFPGTSLSWAILGILQGVIVLALAASLVTGELLPARRKPILLGALSLSLAMFGLLLFGNAMTSEFDSVASMFTYFGLSVVLIALVASMPPYRSGPWPSSLFGAESTGARGHRRPAPVLDPANPIADRAAIPAESR